MIGVSISFYSGSAVRSLMDFSSLCVDTRVRNHRCMPFFFFFTILWSYNGIYIYIYIYDLDLIDKPVSIYTTPEEYMQQALKLPVDERTEQTLQSLILVD